MRRFAHLDLIKSAIPDETTILKFRHLIEQHQLSDKLFEAVNCYLQQNGIKVSQGTMVDATIINAPTSTKNKDKKRDPDMRSTPKNNQYFFGMKVHIGSDVNSKQIHTARVTAANQADINELPNLLREDDQVIFGDASYTSDSYKSGARTQGMTWCVKDKRKPKPTLSSSQKKRNRKYATTRARVEHCFRIINASVWLC